MPKRKQLVLTRRRKSSRKKKNNATHPLTNTDDSSDDSFVPIQPKPKKRVLKKLPRRSPSSNKSNNKRQYNNNNAETTFQDVLEDMLENQDEDSDCNMLGNVDTMSTPEVFDVDPQVIRDKRDNIISLNLFNLDKSNVYQELNFEFLQLEDQSKEGISQKICAGRIKQSLGIPTVLPTVKQVLNEEILDFFGYWVKPNGLDCILDLRSSLLYTVPLRTLILKDDRSFLVNLSNELTSTKLIESNKHRYRYYVTACPSLRNLRNKFLRELIIAFFETYFTEESTRLLASELSHRNNNMNAIIVFDRKQQAIPKLSTSNSIIHTILFSTERKLATIYIDYIATQENFTRGSFATTMINTAQQLCLEKFKHFDIDCHQIKTYLNCRPFLQPIYSRYGFELCDINVLKECDHSEHHVYDHFDVQSWHTLENTNLDQSMIIMRLDGIISRWVNYLSYGLASIENSLYSDNQETPTKSDADMISLTRTVEKDQITLKMNNSLKNIAVSVGESNANQAVLVVGSDVKKATAVCESDGNQATIVGELDDNQAPVVGESDGNQPAAFRDSVGNKPAMLGKSGVYQDVSVGETETNQSIVDAQSDGTQAAAVGESNGIQATTVAVTDANQAVEVGQSDENQAVVVG